MSENRRENNSSALGYEHTLMYGQYKEDLEAYAKAEARRLKALQKLRKKEETVQKNELKTYRSAWQRRLSGYFTAFWNHTFAKLGEDWVFLTVLGILTSLISFGMDYTIAICLRNTPPCRHCGKGFESCVRHGCSTRGKSPSSACNEEPRLEREAATLVLFQVFIFCLNKAFIICVSFLFHTSSFMGPLVKIDRNV